jgi:hypothetical protein
MSWTGDQLVGDLADAIKRFHILLPGWWFSVGLCHVSADATVAPDSAGADRDLLEMRFFDQGFSADIMPPATMAKSLIKATVMGMLARDAYREHGTEQAAIAAIEALGIVYEPRVPPPPFNPSLPQDE